MADQVELSTNDKTSCRDHDGSTRSPNSLVFSSAVHSTRGGSRTSVSDVRDTGEPSPLQAEEYLTLYHTYKSIYLPFVSIPSVTTARQLREERPFLWLCIMTVASRSTQQQQLLGKKVRDTIAQEMISKSSQNLDLLLGLLAYIAWQVLSKARLLGDYY